MTIKPDKTTNTQRGTYPVHSSAPGRAGRAPAAQRGSGETASIPPAGDEVVLSDKAREILAARQAMLASPEVRADRVEEIKRNIRDGVYEHDTDRLADALIRKNIVDLLA
jgi:flagellar biosynthesis anti-sigma factor FlgM